MDDPSSRSEPYGPKPKARAPSAPARAPSAPARAPSAPARAPSAPKDKKAREPTPASEPSAPAKKARESTPAREPSGPKAEARQSSVDTRAQASASKMIQKLEDRYGKSQAQRGRVLDKEKLQEKTKEKREARAKSKAQAQDAIRAKNVDEKRIEMWTAKDKVDRALSEQRKDKDQAEKKRAASEDPKAKPQISKKAKGLARKPRGRDAKNDAYEGDPIPQRLSLIHI